jgi:hypothetical protein
VFAIQFLVSCYNGFYRVNVAMLMPLLWDLAFLNQERGTRDEEGARAEKKGGRKEAAAALK